MWPTVDGLRIVKGSEAGLVRQAVSEMLESLVQEWTDRCPAQTYGIAWFDQWDAEQRIWLLENVTIALFLNETPPPPTAAIHEATIDTIFCHVAASIEEELLGGRHIEPSWRRQLLDAFHEQHRKPASIDLAETNMRRWREVVGQVADRILGNPSYQRAEWFRDGDAKLTATFLQQRGLPDDYLDRIPPLRSHEQTEASISTIRNVLNLSASS